jgi:hypothetical protein
MHSIRDAKPRSFKVDGDVVAGVREVSCWYGDLSSGELNQGV